MLYLATKMILIIIMNIGMNYTCYINGLIRRLLRRQRNMFGTRIKIIWEEQLVDPPIDYITSVNALYLKNLVWNQGRGIAGGMLHKM